MGRQRAIKTDEQRRQYRSFLLQHCGEPGRAGQCERHPPIFEMTHEELRQAALEHLAFAPSRQYINVMTRDLHIRSVRRRARSVPDEELRANAMVRWHRFRERVRQDTQTEAAFMESRRQAARRRRQQPGYREAHRERMRQYRQGLKATVAA